MTHIPIEFRQQGYTILINKVLLITCSAGAVILRKRIVKKCVRFGVLGNIITALPLPVSPRRLLESAMNLDYAVKNTSCFSTCLSNLLSPACLIRGLLFWKMK